MSIIYIFNAMVEHHFEAIIVQCRYHASLPPRPAAPIDVMRSPPWLPWAPFCFQKRSFHLSATGKVEESKKDIKLHNCQFHLIKYAGSDSTRTRGTNSTTHTHTEGPEQNHHRQTQTNTNTVSHVRQLPVPLPALEKERK